MNLKINFRKQCQIYVAHIREIVENQEPSHEDHLVLKKFEDVFEEIQWLPPKRDIDLSMDLVPTVALVSKTPYMMGIVEIKELQMQLDELLKKGYRFPSVSPCNAPVFSFKDKDEQCKL